MKIVKLVLKLVTLILFIVWVTIIFTDYYRTRNNKKPVFCLKETVHKYKDGETYECVGLGYKMFDYNE